MLAGRGRCTSDVQIRSGSVGGQGPGELAILRVRQALARVADGRRGVADALDALVERDKAGVMSKQGLEEKRELKVAILHIEGFPAHRRERVPVHLPCATVVLLQQRLQPPLAGGTSHGHPEALADSLGRVLDEVDEVLDADFAGALDVQAAEQQTKLAAVILHFQHAPANRGELLPISAARLPAADALGGSLQGLLPLAFEAGSTLSQAPMQPEERGGVRPVLDASALQAGPRLRHRARRRGHPQELSSLRPPTCIGLRPSTAARLQRGRRRHVGRSRG
mmetsp:Transcript_45488/g.132432  ORF Transcript_45488/g.132432 Transcript_45488/m.132432 type:complete len:280 (-) Transcript_45488:86-925(-)